MSIRGAVTELNKEIERLTKMRDALMEGSLDMIPVHTATAANSEAPKKSSQPRRDRCLLLSASAYPTPPRLDGPPRKSQARRSKAREARATLQHTAW